MSGLTIGWQYLTGRAVATDPTNRDQAEWPPHPARVFMAMAAAWFETDQDPAEGKALRCLETLGEPQLQLPPHETVQKREKVTVYVPVNDKPGPSAATLQSAPAITRSKQPRTFPSVHLGDACCFLHWPDVQIEEERRKALGALCQKVTRIGHSSSLVRMWVDDALPANESGQKYSVTNDLQSDFHVRRISTGFLDTLIENYGAGPRREKDTLETQIESLKAGKKSIKGKGAREQKAKMDERVQACQQQYDQLHAPAPVRPRIGLWSGYQRADRTEVEPSARRGYFDPEMLVLKRVAGKALPLSATIALTQALRGAILKRAAQQPPPSWVSGHQSDGRPLDTATGHLAIVPLPFVGHEHADGHLLGLGLVFPQEVPRRERGESLGPMLINPDTGKPQEVELRLGRLGAWQLAKSDYRDERAALQARSWTAAPAGATAWASVTPVVLDRFPKTHRKQDKHAWREEVAAIVARSCERSGLPQPETIDIDTSSWQMGSLRAIGKRRRFRGNSSSEQRHDAALGSGFPNYPAKGTNAPRVQVHVWVRFAEPVVGPVLLGAGRFRGYGLLKPYKERADD